MGARSASNAPLRLLKRMMKSPCATDPTNHAMIRAVAVVAVLAGALPASAQAPAPRGDAPTWDSPQATAPPEDVWAVPEDASAPDDPSEWEATPSPRSAPDRTWDAPLSPPSLDPSVWEVDGGASSSGPPSDAFEVDPPDRASSPGPSPDTFDVPSSEDPPDAFDVASPETRREDGGSSRDSWSVSDDDAASADTLRDEVTRSSWGLSTGAFSPPRFSLRLTLLGYRETVGPSIAWTRPTYFEVELGGYADLFARYVEVIPAVEGAPEQTLRHRTQSVGVWARGSLAYPVVSQRGLSDRPWLVKILASLELRALSQRGDWLLFGALSMGVDASLWLRPTFGFSMGASVSLPMFELLERRSVELQPIVRAYIGVAF